MRICLPSFRVESWISKTRIRREGGDTRNTRNTRKPWSQRRRPSQELCRYASACLPESLILGLVPVGREAAVGVEDIAGEVGDRISGATVRRVLSRLVSEGEVRAAPGAASGRQVTAVGYWRPSDDEEIT